MVIYKIFRANEWADLQSHGETLGAPVDLADGYIHFSTPAQATETAAKHFAGADGLVLAAADADALGDELRWEVSRRRAAFAFANKTTKRVLEPPLAPPPKHLPRRGRA